jgi:hypothetical protein
MRSALRSCALRHEPYQVVARCAARLAGREDVKWPWPARNRLPERSELPAQRARTLPACARAARARVAAVSNVLGRSRAETVHASFMLSIYVRVMKGKLDGYIAPISYVYGSCEPGLRIARSSL